VQTLRARRHHDAAATLASVRARHGPSDGRLSAPPLNAARLSPQQPPPQWDSAGLRTALSIGLRGATTAYNANVNTTMRRVPPGSHVFVARDPSASAGDESSLGSLDALPPANLHGHAEWNFSGVLDPVMFRCFLDATDYWFGCSDDSSTGSYDPARECCVVIANDPANATGAVAAGDGEVTPALGIAPRLAAGPSTPAEANADAQLAQARELEAKLAEEYRTVRLLRASMVSHPVLKAKPNALITCAPGSSYTHA
jgi:hypothetical protein